MMNEMLVTAHVGRSLLQSAQHFKTDRAVVWEYVVNSLQYTDPGVQPRVLVIIDERKKSIRIADNGRGMDYDDLQHFFQMHGENIERVEGRPGRGMFGTGKSAAVGIAGTLQVTKRKTRSG
jgi:DNA topoisomerase VI subunit B